MAPYFFQPAIGFRPGVQALEVDFFKQPAGGITSMSTGLKTLFKMN